MRGPRPALLSPLVPSNELRGPCSPCGDFPRNCRREAWEGGVMQSPGPRRLPAPTPGGPPALRSMSPRRRDLLPGRRPSAQPPRRVLVLVTAVSVHTNGTVFATDTDITFVAVTKETGPLEFTWYFGDDAPVRTTSRSIRRRLAVPGGCVRGRHGGAARAPGGTVLPLRASVSPGRRGGGRWDRKAPGQAPCRHQGSRGRFLSQGQVRCPPLRLERCIM